MQLLRLFATECSFAFLFLQAYFVTCLLFTVAFATLLTIFAETFPIVSIGRWPSAVSLIVPFAVIVVHPTAISVILFPGPSLR